MYKLFLEKKIYFVLRFAVAMCFIGHGAFGIITKPIWANYFGVFGIGHNLAYHFMPLVGSIDILLGVIMLVYPVRAIAAWLVLWGMFTASLRPLSGEPLAEMVERAGNFGAPLALLILIGANTGFKGWFSPINAEFDVDAKTRARLVKVLQVSVFLLLAGHGWLNLIFKKALLSQYHSLGFIHTAQVALTAGLFEILAAIMILIRPAKGLLIGLLIWKAFTELFYPHYEIFEWIERGGSYGCILALMMSLEYKTSVDNTPNRLFDLNYKPNQIIT